MLPRFFFLILFIFYFILRFNGKRNSTVFFFSLLYQNQVFNTKTAAFAQANHASVHNSYFFIVFNFYTRFISIVLGGEKKKETKTTITTTTTKKKAHQMLEMVALQNTTDFLQASFWRSDTSSEWCFFFPPLFGYRRIRSFLLKKINCAGHFHCS